MAIQIITFILVAALCVDRLFLRLDLRKAKEKDKEQREAWQKAIAEEQKQFDNLMAYNGRRRMNDEE